MMLTAAAVFTFVTFKDPMTDALTYEAKIGDDRVGLSIYCGDATKGKMEVEIRAGRSLYEFSDSRALVQWRFDEGSPERDYPYWGQQKATFVGVKAVNFASNVKGASRLRVQLRAAYDDDIVLDIPLRDPSNAIGRVVERCPQK